MVYTYNYITHHSYIYTNIYTSTYKVIQIRVRQCSLVRTYDGVFERLVAQLLPPYNTAVVQLLGQADDLSVRVRMM